MKVIRVVCFANGAPCPIAGQYLKSFDFEAYNGQGFGVFTLNSAEAMMFMDAAVAMEFWRTQSQRYPLRADGRPNRPFTSTTVEIIDMPVRTLSAGNCPYCGVGFGQTHSPMCGLRNIPWKGE